MTGHRPGDAPVAVIICVGNELMGDDALGPTVFQRLVADPPPGRPRVHLVGSCGLELLEVLAGEELLLVVDAVALGAPPGSLHILEESDLPLLHGACTHGAGLAETLALGRRIDPGRVPARVVLLGIEGAVFHVVGGEMTPAVSARIEGLLRELEARLP